MLEKITLREALNVFSSMSPVMVLQNWIALGAYRIKLQYVQQMILI